MTGTNVTVEITLIEASLLTLAADLTLRVGYFLGSDGTAIPLSDRGRADLVSARKAIEAQALPVLREHYPHIAAQAEANVRARAARTDAVKDIRKVASPREPGPTGLYL